MQSIWEDGIEWVGGINLFSRFIEITTTNTDPCFTQHGIRKSILPIAQTGILTAVAAIRGAE